MKKGLNGEGEVLNTTAALLQLWDCLCKCSINTCIYETEVRKQQIKLSSYCDSHRHHLVKIRVSATHGKESGVEVMHLCYSAA